MKYCRNALCIVILLVVGCQPRISSVLADTDDLLPCWHSICPGQTTKAEALSSLMVIEGIDVESITDTQGIDRYDYFSWGFTSLTGDKAGRVHYDENSVSYINIIPDGVTLEAIVKRFGEPESMLTISNCGERRWLWGVLIFSNQEMIVEHFDSYWPMDQSIELRPEQKANNVYYLTPDLLEYVLRLRQGNWSSGKYSEVLDSIVAWEGFGQISYLELCPSLVTD